MHLISEAAVQNELNKNPLKTQDKEKTSEQEPEREQDQEIEQVQLEGNIDSLELLKEAGDAVENTNTTSTTNDQVNTPSDGKEDNKTQDETNYSVKDFTGDGWEPCNEVWHVYKNYYPDGTLERDFKNIDGFRSKCSLFYPNIGYPMSLLATCLEITI